ncbi:MAG TPA: plasmid pRiA4b ORF-3 family protein [Bacteroidales bacterium]|nr:plasmid pRiA4b ORF-3 family protein [Bacteroidales bacterium]
MKILLEKITQVDEEAFKPICLKAINSAPMEDCGGIMGYYYILDVLKDPKNKEYESIKEWMGFELEEEWDAKEGELEAINYNFKRFAKAVK